MDAHRRGQSSVPLGDSGGTGRLLTARPILYDGNSERALLLR